MADAQYSANIEAVKEQAGKLVVSMGNFSDVADRFLTDFKGISPDAWTGEGRDVFQTKVTKFITSKDSMEGAINKAAEQIGLAADELQRFEDDTKKKADGLSGEWLK